MRPKKQGKEKVRTPKQLPPPLEISEVRKGLAEIKESAHAIDIKLNFALLGLLLVVLLAMRIP
jgi:hypothetical protein